MTKSLPAAQKERFRALWKRCQTAGAEVDSGRIYENLSRRYCDPHRSYHNWTHVRRCLKQFDLARAFMLNPDAVEMAIWFHDAVYKPSSSQNEQKSASLFLRFARRQFARQFLHKVSELILITTHQRRPLDSDARFIVDIDLSSFGLAWDEFLQDSENVRKERDHVTDEEFCLAHTRFLRSLLGRASFIPTSFLHVMNSPRDTISSGCWPSSNPKDMPEAVHRPWMRETGNGRGDAARPILFSRCCRR